LPFDPPPDDEPADDEPADDAPAEADDDAKAGGDVKAGESPPPKGAVNAPVLAPVRVPVCAADCATVCPMVWDDAARSTVSSPRPISTPSSSTRPPRISTGTALASPVQPNT